VTLTDGRRPASSSWAGKVGRRGARNRSFPTDSGELQWIKSWLLTISILAQNSPKIEDFQPQIWYFWKNIFGHEKNFQPARIQSPFPPLPPCHDATDGDDDDSDVVVIDESMNVVGRCCFELKSADTATIKCTSVIIDSTYGVHACAIK